MSKRPPADTAPLWPSLVLGLVGGLLIVVGRLLQIVDDAIEPIDELHHLDQ